MDSLDRIKYYGKFDLPESKKAALNCINAYLDSSKTNLAETDKYLDEYIENTLSKHGDAEGNLDGAVEEILAKVYTAYESLDIVIKRIKEIQAN